HRHGARPYRCLPNPRRVPGRREVLPMTTTDTDALAERIGRVLNDEGWTFEGVHEPGEYDECEECRRAVDPVAVRVAREVAVEVRKAKAGAWQEGVNFALPNAET